MKIGFYKVFFVLAKNVAVLVASLFLLCSLLGLIPDITASNYISRVTQYLLIVLTFDYNTSLHSGMFITDIVSAAFLKTLILISLSLGLIIFVSIVTAYYGATKVEGSVFKIWNSFLNTISAIPVLLWASILIFIVYITANLVPIYSDFESGSLLVKFLVIFLPVISLTLGDGLMLDYYTRLRNEIETIKKQVWFRGLKARGVNTFGHLIRSLVVPLFNITTSKVAYLISGIIVVEYVYSWQGLGYIIWQALITPGTKDYALIIASSKILLIIVIIFSSLRDLLHLGMNPHLSEIKE